MTYVGAIQKFVSSIGPYYIRGQHIGTLLESFAITLDCAAQSLEFGLRMSQPLRCDTSALPIIGNDRQIAFYPSESESSKRDRCSKWNQLHRGRGCHVGQLKHAQPYFLPDVPMMRIVHQNGSGDIATWHTFDANAQYSKVQRSPSNWNWDGQASKWSRYWVICYVPARLLTLPHYGDGGRYNDGGIYAGGITDQVNKDFVAMVKGWGEPSSRMSGYIIATDPTSFDPTADSVDSGLGWTSLPVGNWGEPTNSVGVRTRLPSAVWIYDTRSN